jgi:hypothetical protein
MKTQYVIRNILGGFYQKDDGYCPFIDNESPYIYQSYEDALDDVSIIISQYMPIQFIGVEIVTIYTN